MPGKALIHHRCVEPTHQRSSGDLVDTLTIRDGRWAYCPGGVRLDGHDWRATGGIPIDEIRAPSPDPASAPRP